MGKDKEDQEKRPEGEATVLPAREAMSLITSDSGAGFMPDMSEMPDTDGAPSGQEKVTDEDRDEHYVNNDSASSET